MRTLLRAVTVCAIIAMTLFVLGTGRAGAASAGIALSPTSGPAGTTVTVTGTGLTASSTVYVCFGGTLATTTPTAATTDASGNFTATITVPVTSPGMYAVTTQSTNTSCSSTSATATANFQVTTLSSSLLLCGPVSAYTAATGTGGGTVTIAGVAVAIASGTTVNGTLTTGTNACVQFTITNGTASAAIVAQNLTSASVVCGNFAAGTTAGTATLGTFPITVASGVDISTLVAGTYYCATLNTSGAATGFLTSLPTAITKAPHAYYGKRVNRMFEF